MKIKSVKNGYIFNTKGRFSRIFQTYLNNLFPDQDQKNEFLQYIKRINNRNNQRGDERIFIIYGGSNSGKDTLISVLYELFKDDYKHQPYNSICCFNNPNYKILDISNRIRVENSNIINSTNLKVLYDYCPNIQAFLFDIHQCDIEQNSFRIFEFDEPLKRRIKFFHLENTFEKTKIDVKQIAGELKKIINNLEEQEIDNSREKLNKFIQKHCPIRKWLKETPIISIETGPNLVCPTSLPENLQAIYPCLTLHNHYPKWLNYGSLLYNKAAYRDTYNNFCSFMKNMYGYRFYMLRLEFYGRLELALYQEFYKR